MITSTETLRKEVRMNAPCSLHAIRITVPEGHRLKLLSQKSGDPAPALLPKHGQLAASVEEGWMLIKHPEDGVVGLPLEGGQHSWKHAWEQEVVDIDICTLRGWSTPDTWKEIASACSCT
jgi:hypothetical protein